MTGVQTCALPIWSRAQDRPFAFLDGLCSKAALEAYLRDIADSDRSLSRQITELLELIRQYGPDAVAGAIEKAATARAFGADYVANILRQQQCPRREQPPLRLRDPRLNELVTDPLSLLTLSVGSRVTSGPNLVLGARMRRSASLAISSARRRARSERPPSASA